MKKCGLPPEEFEHLVHTLQHCHLPVRLQSPLPMQSLKDALRHDKKFEQGTIRFVLLRNLGHPVLTTPGKIDWTEIEAAIRHLSTEA